MAKGPRRRAYQPKVEALEALRMLDAASGSVLAALPSASHVEPAGSLPGWELHTATVDQVLEQESVQQLVSVDEGSAAAGVEQLRRYLSRSWIRAGINRQWHDDCTQAVFATMLEQHGRTGFDRLMSEVGQSGIPQVLSRETDEGADFLRAIDMIKKRAQREKHFLPIDEHLDLASGGFRETPRDQWKGSIEDAIRDRLNPREAELIHETLKGCSPSEIAQRWGVAPKTVSNEKTRALAKLRIALGDELQYD